MVIVIYIDTMMTALDFNFYFYQALKKHNTQKHGNKEKLSTNSFSFITCNFLKLKKLVRNLNFHRKEVFIVLI